MIGKARGLTINIMTISYKQNNYDIIWNVNLHQLQSKQADDLSHCVTFHYCDDAKLSYSHIVTLLPHKNCASCVHSFTTFLFLPVCSVAEAI